MTAATGKHALAGIALAALGVVYGDIGTSPLYAMKEVFAGNHPIPLNEANVLGSLSLFFWALVIVVSLKYVSIIMRADNRGEGGIMALLALASKCTQQLGSVRTPLLLAGVFGASFFEHDGGNVRRVALYMRTLGIDGLWPVWLGNRPDLLPAARAMPTWPAPGSVLRVNGVVIVKIGPPTPQQLNPG